MSKDLNNCPFCKDPLDISEGFIDLCCEGKLPAIIKNCKACDYREERPKYPKRLTAEAYRTE